jgi:hypothetical protein
VTVVLVVTTIRHLCAEREDKKAEIARKPVGSPTATSPYFKS